MKMSRKSSMYTLQAETLWDEDDLLQRLCHTLDFAEEAIRHLGESGYADDDATHCATIRPEAIIAETATLLLAASNVATYALIGPRILRVASLLVPHARSQRMLRSICLEPSMAFDYGMAHICLKRLGFYDADFDALLDLSIASQAGDGREREPHRMLEQEWLRQSWLYPEGLPRLRVNASLTNSALNRTIDLLHGTSEDIHRFTYALRCVRDFNLFPRSLPRCRQELIADAEGMLARCLDRHDYDLAAEVLLAWPLTGENWSPAATFAFRVLCRAQDHQRSEAAEKETVQGKSSLADFHSTYVMGLLCAAVLAPGRRPPLTLPKAAVRMGAYEAVISCFDPDDQRAHWQDELAELEAEEQEAIAEFLLSIALHRAFGKKDFAAMQRLLAVGSALNLVSQPVASQATEMMVRVSQFSAVLSYALPQPVLREVEEYA